jgi:hypothetical protein
MKGIVIAILLCPCLAWADQTVETEDGQRILLRDDGTYQRVTSDPMSCKEPEKYMEIDYHYRYTQSDYLKLAGHKTLVCAVADVQMMKDSANAASSSAYFKYADQNGPAIERDGIVNVAPLPRGDRVHLIDRCTNKWCRVVVYGEAAAGGIRA